MSSELKTNKISPATGTTTTLGDSGDTFDIPSGATLDVTGATVTGLSAGKILQVQITEAAEQSSYIDSTSWSDTGNMSVSITPASASNNIIVFVSDTVYIGSNGFHLYRIYETANSDVVSEALCGTSAGGQWGSPVSLVGYFNPSNTNALTFKTQMRRLDGSASSRMRDSQIEDSGNVFRIVAMEIEG